MKTIILKSVVFASFLVFTSINSFGQAGNFDVDNQTNCDIQVVLHHSSTGTCGNPTNCGAKVGPFTATANSVTTVNNGSGINVWTDIDMVKVLPSSTCMEYDGDCNGAGVTTSCDCNGEDISVIWVDCNNATIIVN